MKILKKMLLIKWYYIEHQIINFDSINFMTGKNGAGKSTIIDALQIVMLGDTRGSFFNKAANDKGGRTLDGYLKGEISEDEEVGLKSKRSGRFTSYIALEFLDTVEKKSFTCGIVFDSYKDMPTEHMFFILDDRIPENHFIDEATKMAMDCKQLKIYFSKNYPKNRARTYKESNKSYQQDFLAKMGAIKPKFYNLFKKSVTFTPINDIEKFISEYVCDVTNEIDIESMKQNIRQYKKLEKDALLMQERIHELKRIENLFLAYKEELDEEVIQNYLKLQSALQIDTNKLKTLQEKYTKNIQEMDKIGVKEEKAKEKLEKLKKVSDKKKEERSNSDIAKKQSELNKGIEEAKQKLNEIEEKTIKTIRNIKNKVSSWSVNVKFLLENKNKIEETKILKLGVDLKDNIEYLLQINEQNIENLEEETLKQTQEFMEDINKLSNEIYFKNQNEDKNLKENQIELENEIKNLKTGIKPYKKELLEFIAILKNELEHSFNENVDIQILADLLEIKNERWKNAIECYINYQMFYLIIAPKYYDEASRIYRRIAQNGMYSGIGIVDVDKIEKLKLTIEKNSLAEEIETENEYAKTYINYLLGKVIKCETVEELRKYKIAITDDGMLYKNYVLRKIADKRGEFHFIGKKSIAEQIKLKQEKLDSIRIRMEEIKTIMEISSNLKNSALFSKEEVEYILSDINRIRNKEEILKQKELLDKELNSLDLSWVMKISEEIDRLEEEKGNVDKEIKKLYGERKVIEERQKNLKEKEIPDTEIQQNLKAKEIENKFEILWIEQIGNPKFEEISKIRSLEQINKKAMKKIEELQEIISKQGNSLVEKRAEYNRQYNFSYNINDNKAFTEELKKLDDIELPKYIEQIKDSREKAYEQFREDFISKLKANIDEVENQIEELNDALKHSNFGTDKYHFTVRPKQEYKKFYDMITDPRLMEGYNLLSEAFNMTHGEAIRELFEKLTSSEGYDETYQKNISIYTDYKTYLSFDLIVTDSTGETQKLSKTLNKKSGGETQTPFYISVLASFSQLYRINKVKYDNTLRLIVFDEAFNKMDEERMKESISLLGKFGFQAIIAAPSEKAGEIMPLVPNALCVIKKGKDTIVREWSREKNQFIM